MKFQSLAASALLALPALSAPVEKRQANIDVTVLQFALTLEHLENVFYKGALTNFTQQQFYDAGFGQDFYNNLHYIAYDEQTHVEFLEAAILAAGYAPVSPCTYSFPYTTPLQFVTLASIIEGVGSSAYLGAAPLITSKAYLTAAGSILATEAIHTSYERAAVNEVPMANPFETPLDPMSVYTLASAFIVSCPANSTLPFTAFPALAVNASTCTCEEPDCSLVFNNKKRSEEWGSWESGSATATATATATSKASGPSASATSSTETCSPPHAGATVTFTATKAIPSGSYVTFVNGLNVASVEGTVSGDNISAAIPSFAAGQTYVFVTSTASNGTLVDSQVLDGPAILEVYPAAPAIDYSEA